MESSKTESWNSFYSRTVNLPGPSSTQNFLSYIPQGGRILDFGAGSGRWAAAFIRDRPDVVVDVLDQHIDRAPLFTGEWAGEKIKMSFEDYTASRSYDAVWSFACLFFLKREAMDRCFHELAKSLLSNGVFGFTMVEAGPAAEALKFHGLSEADILEILRKEGMEAIRLHRDENIQYGIEKTTVPTFFVRARKI